MSQSNTAEKIQYINDAIREGYEPMYELAADELNSDELRNEHGKAWEYYNMSADENGKHPRRDLGE
ncbi:TPA: hypothetical protein ACLFOW_002560 [Yersinia enterocolitica]|uniref:hypothetical protein n=1 Tax=Yersinia enterocolitica TaxID=630 RepID=UPI0028566ED1|nr:hypothetical protein [Yersinia enterocolitica]EKN6241240.1 hypothetical protein [Yersinia enterocolitica]ELI7980681.1 hypothetical protein [Yersinia enterocolitica]ELZ3994739.1 hypothetical protein [Yersinia enterocolitica]HDL6643230.1 hypothetical protein [Yersinia enterocolitica]